MKWSVQISGSRNCTGTVIGSAFQHVLTHSDCCPELRLSILLFSKVFSTYNLPKTVDEVILVSYGVSGSFPRSFQRRYIDEGLKLCLIRWEEKSRYSDRKLTSKPGHVYLSHQIVMPAAKGWTLSNVVCAEHGGEVSSQESGSLRHQT